MDDVQNTLDDRTYDRIEQAVRHVERLMRGIGHDSTHVSPMTSHEVTIRVLGPVQTVDFATSGSGGGGSGPSRVFNLFPAVVTERNFSDDDPTKTWFDSEEVKAFEINGRALHPGTRYKGLLVRIDVWAIVACESGLGISAGGSGSGAGSGSGSGGTTTSGTITAYRYQCAPDSDHLIETVITYRPFIDENGNLQFEEVDTPGA
jgi:hypothetical protein